MEPTYFDPQSAGLLSATASPVQQAAVQQAIQKILADPNQMTTITGQNRGGSNAWLWQPTEQNTKYQDYLFGGQNNYMTGEVAKYLKALGYSGNLASGGNISDQDAQAINSFLQERGLSVQTGTHQVPGASQYTGIQRIVDANGVPVAVDARNNRYDANDRFTDIAKAGAIAAAGYGLGSAAGLWGGAAPAAGAGTGAAAAGGSMVMTPMGPAFIPAAAGGGATMGAISSGIGGAIAGGLGGAVAGGGLLSSLGKVGSTVGSALGSAADVVGGGKNLAGLVGGIAGAMEGGKDQTATTTQQIDPRMAQYLYGSGYGDKNSLLGAAQDWWKNNQSGMNANMQQGLDTLKSLYTSPAYSQGYTQMRDVGQGLLGRPIAGNPFTQGGLLGSVPAQQGTQPMQPPSPDVGIPQLPRPAWSI